MKNTLLHNLLSPFYFATKFGLAFCLLLITYATSAKEVDYQTSQGKLDNATRARVISSLSEQLENGYVFPSKAKEMVKLLSHQQKKGEYKHIKSADEFAATLTKQLQQQIGDKHLQVEFNPRGLPAKEDPEEIEAREKFEEEMWRAHNFGIEKIERLRFNIGYFKLSAFGPVNEVGPLLASTMNLLNNMDSLIIDLRGNFGGNEQTVQLLTSYFLDKRTHLLNMHTPKDNRIEQTWSIDYVEGKRFPQDKDIYILIDNNSFSAAEDFSYTMKNLNRATLIGETTGGAAHSGDSVRLDQYFSLFLPTSRAISPITKTNWEGKGVNPNVRVPGEKALKKAQTIILKKLMAEEKDPRRVERIKSHVAALQK